MLITDGQRGPWVSGAQQPRHRLRVPGHVRADQVGVCWGQWSKHHAVGTISKDIAYKHTAEDTKSLAAHLVHGNIWPNYMSLASLGWVYYFAFPRHVSQVSQNCWLLPSIEIVRNYPGYLLLNFRPTPKSKNLFYLVKCILKYLSVYKSIWRKQMQFLRQMQNPYIIIVHTLCK